MAINTLEFCDSSRSPTMGTLKRVRTSCSGRMKKPNYDADSIKRAKTKKKKNSPYLYGEKIQLFSRMTEKRSVHKKNEVFSSNPMANNIYKANSDEFKALKKSKQKARKSVLTLPNVPAPMPKTFTVSDMNDSDCLSSKRMKKFNTPKKLIKRNKTKSPIQSKGFEFYDRDARHLDFSFTDLSVQKGDVNTFLTGPVSRHDEDAGAQDVWSVLRNINQFHFRPTPRIADEDSLSSKKKKMFTKKYRNRKGRRLIETCRTEEVAYVADFEILSKTSASRSSSFDRVTVINNEGLQNVPKLEKAVAGTQNSRKITFKPNHEVNSSLNDKNLFRNAPKNNLKIGNPVAVLNNHNLFGNLKPANIRDNHVAFTNHHNAFINNNNRPANVKNNKVAFMNNHNTLTKLFNNTVNPAAANGKRPDSPITIDSSNCLRTDNESNCTLKPNLIHPNAIKDLINENCEAPFNLESKIDDTEMSSNEKLTTGMTQMVLNHGINSTLNKGLQKPKPRLVTTMPSAATMPKLTTSDIKRRIAQIKFPLVVLGKDQLSSTLEVFEYDPPQFDGLNKHIWPFMLEWKKKNTFQKKCQPKTSKGHQTNSYFKKGIYETSLDKAKKASNYDVAKKRHDWKRGIQPDTTTLPIPKKVKPMRHFKDKMLKLLYKNSSPVHVTQNTEMEQSKVDASTEMSVIKKDSNITFSIVEQKKELVPKKVVFAEQIGPNKTPTDVIKSLDKPRGALETLNMKMPGSRYPWAKAKWASDFIENVMKRIRNGSYYAVEDKKDDNTTLKKSDIGSTDDTKEVSIQTTKDLEAANKADFEQNYSQSLHTLIADDGYEPLVNIPGFDDVPPRLEVKTLNSKLIEVKNCLTNITVQFDVSVPDKRPSYFLGKNCSSTSFVPVVVTNSNTKIYKCSTTIINAVLPAEICSVIPQLMKDIFQSTTTASSSIPSPQVNLSEFSECESDAFGSVNSSSKSRPVVENHTWMNHYHPRAENSQVVSSRNKYWRYSPNSWTGPQNTSGYWSQSYGWPEYAPLYMSPELKKMLKGRFGSSPRKQKDPKLAILKIKPIWSASIIVQNLCPMAIMPAIMDPTKLLTKYYESKKEDNLIRTASDCTTLALYKPREVSWFPRLGDITNVLQKMWQYCKFNIHFMVPNFTNEKAIRCNRDFNNITVDMIVGNEHGIEKKMSVTITHVNSFFNSLEDSQCILDQPSTAKICAIDDTLADDNPKEIVTYVKNKHSIKKSKEKLRRSFRKLYNKCKSTSNIEGNKLSTPLNKITNIEDFTLALGSAKELCSVFDGYSGQKILKCVREMKPWVQDITPRQALLVVLLANKKETPNLLRCLPVLIQGIAVNRITRSVELDMEIEVIEREKVELAECEGINYISATLANKDSLYEELSWIAKTTASDYHKPFDESSEKLLKSLLGKRKKLSPSYLRVMARYVGLGLLKTQ